MPEQTSEPARRHAASAPRQAGRRRVVAVVVALGLLGVLTWWGIRFEGQPAPSGRTGPVAAPGPVAPAAPGDTSTAAPASSSSAPPPDAAKEVFPPVSLAGWKLTLPEAGAKGTAASVEPANSAPPWLTRTGGGSLTFWAPVNGATTANSDHPRTELVSLHTFAAGASSHTLTATLSVAQAPAGNPDIIIGQIHGADDIKSVPFVMMHYDAGTIRVVVKRGQSGSAADKYSLISGVPIGARFSYTISDAGNGTMTFSASYGSTNRTVSAPIPDAFRNATVRFQAGAYQQGVPGSGAADGARLTFYALRETPS